MNLIAGRFGKWTTIGSREKTKRRGKWRHGGGGLVRRQVRLVGQSGEKPRVKIKVDD